jgi:hypothetical protein
MVRSGTIFPSTADWSISFSGCRSLEDVLTPTVSFQPFFSAIHARFCLDFTDGYVTESLDLLGGYAIRPLKLILSAPVPRQT